MKKKFEQLREIAKNKKLFINYFVNYPEDMPPFRIEIISPSKEKSICVFAWSGQDLKEGIKKTLEALDE